MAYKIKMNKQILFLICMIFLILSIFSLISASTVVVRSTTYYPDFYDCITSVYLPCQPFINPENLFDTDMISYGTNTPWDGVSDWNMSNVLIKFDVPASADLSQSYIYVTDNCGGGGSQRTVNISIANAYLVNGDFIYIMLEGYEGDGDNAYWMELLTQEPSSVNFNYPNLSSWGPYGGMTEVFTWYNDGPPKVGYCSEVETLTKKIYDVHAEFSVNIPSSIPSYVSNPIYQSLQLFGTGIGVFLQVIALPLAIFILILGIIGGIILFIKTIFEIEIKYDIK